MDVSELDSLKSENQKLRNYISLVNAEIELSQRLYEIKQNFTNSPDSERIIVPILDRISKIKSEKDVLENKLKTNEIVMLMFELHNQKSRIHLSYCKILYHNVCIL